LPVVGAAGRRPEPDAADSARRSSGDGDHAGLPGLCGADRLGLFGAQPMAAGRHLGHAGAGVAADNDLGRTGMKTQGFRQANSWLHTWSGLLLGWLLFAIFLTGTLSYFRQEITYW